MHKNTVLLLITMVTTIAPLSFAETTGLLHHSSGAQCYSSLSPSVETHSESLLLKNITEKTLLSESFRVWFLAQQMLTDGHPITFNSDGSIESEVLFPATKWRIFGLELALSDAEGRELYRFRYSEVCDTLVHEYELFSTPQVLEIAIVH